MGHAMHTTSTRLRGSQGVGSFLVHWPAVTIRWIDQCFITRMKNERFG